MNYFDPYVASPLASKVPGYSNLQGGSGVRRRQRAGRHQYNWDTNNLAPRIGFAFKASDKTVIRGGWGNFFGVSPQQATSTVGPFGLPHAIQLGQLAGWHHAVRLFRQSLSRRVSALRRVQRRLLTQTRQQHSGALQETFTPYSMQWNLNIQRNCPAASWSRSATSATHGFQLNA